MNIFGETTNCQVAAFTFSATTRLWIITPFSVENLTIRHVLAARNAAKTVHVERHEEALLPICTEILSWGARHTDEHFLEFHRHMRTDASRILSSHWSLPAVALQSRRCRVVAGVRMHCLFSRGLRVFRWHNLTWPADLWSKISRWPGYFSSSSFNGDFCWCRTAATAKLVIYALWDEMNQFVWPRSALFFSHIDAWSSMCLEWASFLGCTWNEPVCLPEMLNRPVSYFARLPLHISLIFFALYE